MAHSYLYAWYYTGSSMKWVEVLWIGEVTPVYLQGVIGATYIHVSNNPLQLQNYKYWKGWVKEPQE